MLKTKGRRAVLEEQAYYPRMNSRPFTEPTEQEIQHAAYYLWEQEGRPQGRDLEIWFAARERLKHLVMPHHEQRRRTPVSRPIHLNAR